MNRMAPLVAALILIATGAARAETLQLPHGIAVEMPDGWQLDGPAEGSAGRDGMTRIHLVCETPECERTQESCTLLLKAERLPGTTDLDRVKALYESPFDRYLRIRATLKATSRDAEILVPLALAEIGARPWYVIETDARHSYKSGLFAETVVDGWYLGVICKTCETGKIRHQAARRLLESVRLDD